MSTGTLRVAILCDRETLEPWHRRCVERLLAVDGVAVAGFVRTEGGESTAPRSRMVSRLYERRFHRRTRRESVLLSEVAPGVPAVSTVDASAVRELNVDIALSLVLGGAAVDALDQPRYGVWAFDFDLDPAARAGFGEVGRVLAGEPTTEIALVRLEATTDRVAVLRQGWFRGDARAPQNGVRRARIEAAGWPALVCAALLRGESSRAEGSYVDMTAVTQPSPSSLDILRYGLAVLGSNLNFAWGHLFRHQQWNIGIVDKPIQALLDAKSPPPVRWFPLDGKRSFLADPFGTGATILCEYFDYRRNKGTICSIDVSDGEFSAPQTAFELPVHVSYPFLVEDDGALYCVPETIGSREVGLFRAGAFPHGWTKVGALVSDVSVVDPTVFRHAGRWWLTCAQGERGAEANLLVWHAPRIEGPWTPHAANPVKTDVRSTRPAGTPFEYEGILYRPAQDCSRGYGERIVINRVTRLTPDDFAEEPVTAIEATPDSPYPAGRHTLSAFGDATLIDGHRFVFVGVAFWNFLRILAREVAGRRT